MWVTLPDMTPFDPILHFSLVLTAVRLRAKFEFSSFNRSRDIRGSQNSKSDPHMTPFDLILQILDISQRFQCVCQI